MANKTHNTMANKTHNTMANKTHNTMANKKRHRKKAIVLCVLLTIVLSVNRFTVPFGMFKLFFQDV
jgi:hypothetical protein